MRASYKWTLIGLAFAPFGVVACADILGFERLTYVPDGGVPDAPTATDPPDVPTVPTTSSCEDSLQPPPRPTVSDSDGGAAFSLAVNSFDMGIGETPLGLDIDRTCTIDLASSSCATNVAQTAFTNNIVDKTRGIDNASFNLLKFLGSQYPALSGPQIDAYVKQGAFGFLVDVVGYNGAANDPIVSVSFRPTLGIEPRPDGGAGSTDGGDAGRSATAPLFDGKDSWIINEEYSFADRVGSGMFLDVKAYVRDGVLVATFPEVVLPVSKDTSDNILPIKLHDFTLLATLKKNDGLWEATGGVMAGSWAVEDAFPAVRNFAFDSLSAERLCEQPVYDNGFITTFCDGRDLPAQLTLPRSTPCAAVSAGFGFTAVQAINSESSALRRTRPRTCAPAACAGEDAGRLDSGSRDGAGD